MESRETFNPSPPWTARPAGLFKTIHAWFSKITGICRIFTDDLNMSRKKKLPLKSSSSIFKSYLPLFFFLAPVLLYAAPLYSPSWGFSINLPEDYEFNNGNRRDRFSFGSPDGAILDIVVYAAEAGRAAPYSSVESMARDVQSRLRSSGETSYFEYRNKKAAILELKFNMNFTQMTGWGLAIELKAAEPKLLLALSYGPAQRPDLQILHFSILDSIAPSEEDRIYPGPIMEFSYPRVKRLAMPLWNLGEEAWFFKEDEEANQALVEREFNVLKRYVNSPMWKEAWIRYYQALYRDSYERLANAAFIIERKMNIPPLEDRDFAGQVLKWIQSFDYERDFSGSDFISPVSAVLEGRGDCDNRAMLMAIILNHANIPAAMMVSRDYNHAMALADLHGIGARFETGGKRWLVAETTANVSIGLIAEEMSDPKGWIGIVFQ